MAAKSNEANVLRQENRALLDENTRLSDLTRMLLSSPAFSTFLDTLGASELSTAAAATESAGRATEPADSTALLPTIKKDPNPHHVVAEEQLQASQANNPQIGMTLIPEHPIDFSTLDANLNTWNLGNLPAGLWGNTQPQVFTVTEIPTGPPVDILDAGALSGKTSHLIGSHSSLDEAKSEIPRVESMPVISESIQQPSETAPGGLGETDESDPAFALFADGPVSSRESPVARPSSQYALPSVKGVEGVESEKKQNLIAPVEQDQDQEHSDALRMEQFRRLCRSTEAAFERISRITSHL